MSIVNFIAENRLEEAIDFFPAMKTVSRGGKASPDCAARDTATESLLNSSFMV